MPRPQDQIPSNYLCSESYNIRRHQQFFRVVVDAEDEKAYTSAYLLLVGVLVVQLRRPVLSALRLLAPYIGPDLSYGSSGTVEDSHCSDVHSTRKNDSVFFKRLTC